MAVEIHEAQIEQPKKDSERKIEQFTKRVLPGIYERTKESGHFRDMKTHELISPSDMSSDKEEDMKQYRVFTLQLHTLLSQSEKGSPVSLKDSENTIRTLFEGYGKGREQGQTHYFVEYLKNKSAQIIAALELVLDGYIPQERLTREIRKVLLELSGKEITKKKNQVLA